MPSGAKSTGKGTESGNRAAGAAGAAIAGAAIAETAMLAATIGARMRRRIMALWLLDNVGVGMHGWCGLRGQVVRDSAGGEVQVQIVRGLGAGQVHVDAEQGAGGRAAGRGYGQVPVQGG